jgi:hypothetical protein
LAGTGFVLLDGKPLLLDPVAVGGATSLAATGLVDPAPVEAAIAMAGATLRPLVPVHPRTVPQPDGTLHLAWTRRARGAWDWRDLVETPLNEEAERYRVGLGDDAAPVLQWEVTEPWLDLAPALVAELSANHAGAPLWVRQIGSHAASDRLLLLAIS